MDNTVQGQMKKDLLRKPCTLPEIRRPLAEKAVFLVDSRRKARSEPSLHYFTGEQLVRCCAVFRSSENEPHPVRCREPWGLVTQALALFDPEPR